MAEVQEGRKVAKTGWRMGELFLDPLNIEIPMASITIDEHTRPVPLLVDRRPDGAFERVRASLVIEGTDIRDRPHDLGIVAPAFDLFDAADLSVPFLRLAVLGTLRGLAFALEHLEIIDPADASQLLGARPATHPVERKPPDRAIDRVACLCSSLSNRNVIPAKDQNQEPQGPGWQAAALHLDFPDSG